MRHLAVLLLFALAVACCVQPAAAQNSPSSPDFRGVLAGKVAPLTLALKDLNTDWTAFTTSSGEIGWMAMLSVHYSKGEIISIGGESYLIAYSVQLKMTDYAGVIYGRRTTGPGEMTPDTVLWLVLLNLRSIGSIRTIRPFDMKAEAATYKETYDAWNTALARAESGSPEGEIASNIKNLAVALQMYLADYDAFPDMKDADTVKEALSEYVENDAVFNDPTGKPYLANVGLSRKAVTDIGDPAKTVAFYQADPGSDGRREVAFVDGSVRKVTEDEWNTLKGTSAIP